MTARSLAEQALELAKEALVLTEHATIRMSAKEIVVLAERCLALEAAARRVSVEATVPRLTSGGGPVSVPLSAFTQLRAALDPGEREGT